MQKFSSSERRTIRICLIAVSVYLVLFYGSGLLGGLQEARMRRRELLEEITTLRGSMRLEEEKKLLLDELKRDLAIDWSRLEDDALVATSLSAIRKAAARHSIRIESQKEIQSSASSEELARFEFQCGGKIDGFARFVHALEHLGLPLIVGEMRVRRKSEPGAILSSLNVAVLNMDGWKETPKDA